MRKIGFKTVNTRFNKDSDNLSRMNWQKTNDKVISYDTASLVDGLDDKFKRR